MDSGSFCVLECSECFACSTWKMILFMRCNLLISGVAFNEICVAEFRIGKTLFRLNFLLAKI